MTIIYIAIFILLIIADQLSKYAAFINLQPIGRMPIINGLIEFSYVQNEGAAFGMLQGARWFFIPLTIVIVTAMVIFFIKLPKTKQYEPVRILLVIIGAGAIGNFINRLISGYVVDFFNFMFIDFPVFNLADIFISVGAVLLGIYIIFFLKDDKDGKKR